MAQRKGLEDWLDQKDIDCHLKIPMLIADYSGWNHRQSPEDMEAPAMGDLKADIRKLGTELGQREILFPHVLSHNWAGLRYRYNLSTR